MPTTIAEHPNTEPGLTRLIKADRLGKALGIRNLWVKDDTGNPTHSFKDRVVAVALAAARELGFRVLCCPSTGNLANAVAAAAARAGWDSVVLIPSSLEQAKVLTTAVYGGTLLAVDGNYDDVNRLATELAAEHEDWAFVNVNVRPYYAEGSKTLGYEVAEQLGWRLPEQIVVPVASGSQLTKVDKGFTEFGKLGLVEATPYKVFGAQATGCSPVAQAFAEGHDVIRPVRPDTIARSLAIGNPADGPYVLDAVRRTGGAVARRLGRRGRRGHPAAGRHRGRVRRDGGRGHGGHHAQAGRVGPARPRRRDRAADHRRRAEDARRGERPGRPHRHGAEHARRPCARPCGRRAGSRSDGRTCGCQAGSVAAESAPGPRGGRRSSRPPGPAPPRRTTPRRALG